MKLQTIEHRAGLCVVGGGLAGLCTAIAAARHGVQVVLMQDRPVLGGNSSSEIRMWVAGALGENNRETGILEEIMMENQYRNPDKNYYIWDGILYGKVRAEKNITLLLNCSCLDAQMQGGVIRSVTGWQTTTQTYHRVCAELFADCSGDSILAPLTGAPYREGREARSEFGESIEPETADRDTMGLSCMLQAEQTDEAQPFIAPAWAEKLTAEQLRHRMPDLENPLENFWYLELGGKSDTIGQAEAIRAELLSLAYGLWDYLKNDPQTRQKNQNWRLRWIGALPGKRESRRYIGAYTMNQNDVEAGGRFRDEIAYGGWSMDDHNPAGFRTSEPATIFHPAPSPYGIPFRCLYSITIENLMFAGRNISVTHAALSSCRVMGTCALLGQAVGTAAAIAIRQGCRPGTFGQQQLDRLQTLLMDDDCFLPHRTRPISPLCAHAVLTGGGRHLHCLIDGIDRDRPDASHAWEGEPGDTVQYLFASPVELHRLRIVFDSDLNRRTLPYPENLIQHNMLHNRRLHESPSHVPTTMVKAFRVTAQLSDGTQKIIWDEPCNYLRLRRKDVSLSDVVSLTLAPLETWGEETIRIFAFEAE